MSDNSLLQNVRTSRKSRFVFPYLVHTCTKRSTGPQVYRWSRVRQGSWITRAARWTKIMIHHQFKAFNVPRFLEAAMNTVHDTTHLLTIPQHLRKQHVKLLELISLGQIRHLKSLNTFSCRWRGRSKLYRIPRPALRYRSDGCCP